MIPIESVVYAGDCLDILREWPSGCVDLIVTDPPYRGDFTRGGGMLGSRRVYKRVREDVGSRKAFDVVPYAVEMARVCKVVNMYIWCGRLGVYDLLGLAKEKEYFWDILVWDKSHYSPAKSNHYLPNIEYCVFLRRSGATFNGNLPFKYYLKTLRGRAQLSVPHPAVKPLSVILPSIAISSNPGDIVLDPFCGSGTTLVAAQLLGRRYIGIDRSDDFVNLSRSRLANEVELFDVNAEIGGVNGTAGNTRKGRGNVGESGNVAD